MVRKLGWLKGALLFVGFCAAVATSRAAGIDDFKLARAIPADVMIAVHARTHAGQEFVHQQFARVWKAVEEQQFDKDLKRIIRGAVKENQGDVEAFDQQWQQIMDLAAGVHWSGLAGREFAMAIRIAPPFGADFAYLLMPTEGQVADDFKGLADIVQNLLNLAPPGMFNTATEGEGARMTYRVTIANQPQVPIKLTLARYDDVIVLGIGTSMADQVLALLSGDAQAAGATLASTERFKAAFAKLPPPQDSLYFIDIGQLMTQTRGFCQLIMQNVAAETPAATEGQAAPNLGFITKIVDALDIWDYVAGVTSTSAMVTRTDELTVLKSDAKTRPLFKVLYNGAPLKHPLKYIPKVATEMNASSGIDLPALYRETLAFIKKEVPEGEGLIAQFDALKAQWPVDVEGDVLDWLGSSMASFSAPIPTPFLPGWVMMIEVRDEAKANAALDKFEGLINGLLEAQNGGCEDAKLDAAPGFRRVILPGFFAMIPGLGRPIFGVKDGLLFVSNGPEILTAALEAGAGKAEDFSKNERFLAEGLPLSGDVVAVSFQDLSKLGEQLGQLLPAMAGIMRMMPDVGKVPMLGGILNVVTKVGNVCKQLDFFKSACAVTTFDGQVAYKKELMNYQEPPKPPSGTPVPTEPAKEPTTGR